MIFITHFRRKPTSRVVVRLAGFSWTRGDFCRGWLITGDTGSGKTRSGITPLLFQVFQNEPTWGGLCIDDKGLYWETLSQMAKHFGREDDLILLQVRPDGAGSSWQPRHTYNLTSDRSIPTTPSRRQASIQLPVSARPVTKSMSDYNCIDVIREARATVVAAAQSSTSFIPPLGREKARVFTLNLPIASSSKRPTKKVPSKEPTSSAKARHQEVVGLFGRKDGAELLRAGRAQIMPPNCAGWQSTIASLSIASRAIVASCCRPSSRTEKLHRGSHETRF